MNKAFKFPPTGNGGPGRRSPGLTITPPPPVRPVPPIIVVHEAKDSVDARLKEAMEGGMSQEKKKGEGVDAGKGKGRTVEPPTPDLDNPAGGIPIVGKEDADEGGEIVEVDLS